MVDFDKLLETRSQRALDYLRAHGHLRIEVGVTLCRDGFKVSTLGFPWLDQVGGDFETMIEDPSDGSLLVAERYAAILDAATGHNEFVAAHGGRAGFWGSLALALAA